MKTFAIASLLAAVAPLTEAHYIFNRLYVNGASIGGEYAYTRKNTNSYNPAFTNDIVDSNDLRCNVGAKAGATNTYTVKAGDKIGFKLFNNEFIEHPGPGFVYVSKAPGKVSEYAGDGDWVKVMETGLCGSAPGVNTNWCSWQKDRLEWTIQQNIPPGEYLVRVEHIGLHEGHVGKAQFYIECFQLKIEGNGGGVPGPVAKIPGIYKKNDAGIAFSIWNNPKSYTMPGPAVWTGANTGANTGNSGSAPAPAPSSAAPSSVVTPSKPAATSAAPSSPSPSPSAAAVAHTSENCTGKLARTRRAFREMLARL